MHSLHQLFHTATANSSIYREGYIEIRPSPALAPYVVCFWAPWPAQASPRRDAAPLLVVPDACMDILLRQPGQEEPLIGRYTGLGELPYYSDRGSITGLVLGIRFAPWAVHLFTHASLQGGMPDALDAVFCGWQRALERALMPCKDLPARVQAAEAFLLRQLDGARPSPPLLNAMHAILRDGGASPVAEICAQGAISQRQMERLFQRHVGLSMKKVANLVRYQRVWNDLLHAPRFSIQDAVYRYGYSDQAHLLRSFKRHHGMGLSEAKACAMGDPSMSKIFNTDGPPLGYAAI